VNKLENGQLHEEIERLRALLNRKKDFYDIETVQLSMQLDKLIVQAMKNGRFK
jgi:hypothetical protein